MRYHEVRDLVVGGQGEAEIKVTVTVLFLTAVWTIGLFWRWGAEWCWEDDSGLDFESA